MDEGSHGRRMVCKELDVTSTLTLPKIRKWMILSHTKYASQQLPGIGCFSDAGSAAYFAVFRYTHTCDDHSRSPLINTCALLCCSSL